MGYNRLSICLPESRRDHSEGPYSEGDGSARSCCCCGKRRCQAQEMGKGCWRGIRRLKGPGLLRNLHYRGLSRRPLLRLGALRHKVNPLSPSIGERSLFLAVLTLIVHQGSRTCDQDGYSVARGYHSRGSKQALQGFE